MRGRQRVAAKLKAHELQFRANEITRLLIKFYSVLSESGRWTCRATRRTFVSSWAKLELGSLTPLFIANDLTFFITRGRQLSLLVEATPIHFGYSDYSSLAIVF